MCPKMPGTCPGMHGTCTGMHGHARACKGVLRRACMQGRACMHARACSGLACMHGRAGACMRTSVFLFERAGMKLSPLVDVGAEIFRQRCIFEIVARRHWELLL